MTTSGPTKPFNWKRPSIRIFIGIVLYGYVSTVAMLTLTVTFIYLYENQLVSRFLGAKFSDIFELLTLGSIVLARLSFFNIIPLAILGLFWALKLKSQTTIETNQLWLISGGVAGIIIPFGGFIWLSAIAAILGTIEEMEAGTLAALLFWGVPIVQVVGVFCGHMIGYLTWQVHKRYRNKIAAASFFLVSFVLISIAAGLAFFSNFWS